MKTSLYLARARTRLLRQLATCALLLTACDQQGATAFSGLDAWMRASGNTATYIEGDFPVATDDDAGTLPRIDGDASVNSTEPPLIDTISSPNNSVHPGAMGKTVQAFVSPNTRSVAYKLEGDKGYWLVAVGSESLENAPDYESAVSLDFSEKTPKGPRKLWVAAANREANFGPARFLQLNFIDSIPKGALVVSLNWSANMDLDLIVVSPNGDVLTPDGLHDKEGSPVKSTDSTPFIDIDSNQGCAIDNIRRENAVFEQAPAKGKYRVYVRNAQTCGFPAASWRVSVLLNGKTTQRFLGTSYASQIDTPNAGPDGPGVLAAEFDVGN
jgi:hypothetical protein